jgi:hypothetical protein
MAIIEIMDVPEHVHDAPAQAARARGQSLESYLRDFLAKVARRARDLPTGAGPGAGGTAGGAHP